MAELTVASTTDEQAAINAAAGAPAEEKEEQIEGVEAEQDGDQQEERRESKASVQKRIDKLTRQKYEAQEFNKKLLERLDSLEKRISGDKQPTEVKKEEKKTEPEQKARPKQEDFQTFEDYSEAVADWKFDQRLAKLQKEAQEAQSKADAQKALKKVADEWDVAVKEAGKRYDDFDEVLNSNRQIPEDVGQIIVEQKLTDVAYYLGKHPEICKEMMKMSPRQALTRLGEIKVMLEPVETDEPSSNPVPKIKTQAGTPIRPVTSSATKSSVPIDELPYNEYRKIRDRQEKERYRR